MGRATDKALTFKRDARAASDKAADDIGNEAEATRSSAGPLGAFSDTSSSAEIVEGIDGRPQLVVTIRGNFAAASGRGSPFHSLGAISPSTYHCVHLRRTIEESFMKHGKLVATAACIFFSATANAALCPDGTYVAGNKCTLAPDGTYVGGNKATLAPDGSYVGGSRSTLTPDGSYVGGSKSTLCPDGSYVSGTQCKLQPNGSYTGR